MNGRRRQVKGDQGIALLLVIGIVAICSVLAVTVSTIAVNNVQNTTRDKQSGSAFATSEAGVAEAVERIRSGEISLSGLTCAEPGTSCTGGTMSWTSRTNPMQVPVDGGAGPCTAQQTCVKVWIGTVQAYSPPAVKVGSYRVHSLGLFGNGPGARAVVVDITVKPQSFPIGVFGERVTGGGGTAVYSESLFTRACVSPRQTGSGNGTRFTGTDANFGQPAAAHSTTHISTSNNCGSSGYIHKGGSNCPNVAALNWDQSGDGGGVSGGQCFQNYTRPDGTKYPDASPTGNCVPRADGLCDSTAFGFKDLERYGYQPRGLTETQYAALKSRALAGGTYNIASGAVSNAMNVLAAAGNTQPVLYIDCSTGGSICDSSGVYRISANDFPTTFQQAPDPEGVLTRCAAGPQPVVTIVINRGSLVFQSGNSQWLDAAIFIPYGSWTGNGGYNVLGTLFADDLSLGGNENFRLDKCFVRDIAAPLLEIKQTGFREDDAADIN